MSPKAFRNISYLQILLLITVFSIVLLDIRFHFQTESQVDSEDNPQRKDLELKILELIGGQKNTGNLKLTPISELTGRTSSFDDETTIMPAPSKYRPRDSKGKRNDSAGMFRKIALQDIPPEVGPEWVPSKNEVPIPRFPKTLLVGFSKCGTSSLLAFLNVHPDIVSLDWETDYFCDRVYFKYSLHWYRMRMPLSTSTQVTIEKSPCYISERQALERIYAFNSSIKILVILRDPISRITSQHGQYLASFKSSGKPKLSLEDRYLNPNTGKLYDGAVQKWGIFTSRTENLFDVFPRDQIHIIDGDKFVNDPLPVLSGIEKFLGVHTYFSDQDIQFDRSKGFYCPRYRSSKQTECMGFQKGRPHVEMSPGLRRSLQKYLRPYSERLFELIDQRMDWDLGD